MSSFVSLKSFSMICLTIFCGNESKDVLNSLNKVLLQSLRFLAIDLFSEDLTTISLTNSLKMQSIL